MTHTAPQHQHQPRLTNLRISGTQIAGLASIGAGLIHAAAIGVHAEHAVLSRLFVAVAAAQIAVGLAVLVRGGRPVAVLSVLVNGGAVAVWAVTRILGISAIDGLEHAETPQFIDTVCAALGALAAAGAAWALLRRRTLPAARLGLPAVTVGALTVIAMMQGATHVHGHGDTADPVSTSHQSSPDETAGHHHDVSTNDEAAGHQPQGSRQESVGHHHEAPGDAPGGDDLRPSESAWPRPWDPTAAIDFSGVAGVTAEQQARAEVLVTRTLEVLPQFADTTTLESLGFHSIGDAATGYEHYLNVGYVGDDTFLDPSKPESLVYRVDGERRTLVSAMYIAAETPIDDPELVNYGGSLMQWHVHTNLCWAPNDAGVLEVVAVTDDHGGTCPPDTIHAGGDNPMVHVWIVPHHCGPFAALEGHGAGQADARPGQRTDLCAHDHATADGS